MDQFTRRIIGFGIHRGTVEGRPRCSMIQRAIQGPAPPKYLSTDNDRLYRFHQWQANLRVLEVMEIKTVPYVPLPIPWLSGWLEPLGASRPGGEAAGAIGLQLISDHKLDCTVG